MQKSVFQSNMNNSKLLEIATKTYYWKPMAAFFRYLEMRLYSDLRVVLNGPILDLGCGDGGVAYMLRKSGLIERPLCGIDISHRELKKAKERNEHLYIQRTDANCLPFRNESFSSILCNGALESISPGVETSLKEIVRVLKTNGMFVATVPTDKFIDVIILPKVLNKYSSTWSAKYEKKLNKRLTHFNVYSPEQWGKIFENNGLKIIDTKEFFSYKAGFIWNIMTLQIFRIFSVLKFVKNRKFINFFSNLLKIVIEKIYSENISEISNFGYMFIIAKK